MGKKKQVFITDILSFDEDKFKAHVRKRKKEKLINSEEDYIRIIKDVIYNFDRAFEVKRKRNKDQYNLFVSETGWVVLFSINDFIIHSCLKLYKGLTPDTFLEFMKEANNTILSYKEVDYENYEFQRIIKAIQSDTR